jgi:hypothetical protein
MNLSTKQIIGISTLVLSLVFVSTGCKSTPKPKPVAWNLSITKKTPASIEVDLIGVTENEKQFYQGLTMENYWPNSAVRRDADKLTQILRTNEPWLVGRIDPIWAEWKKRGVTTLIVVANLPVPNGLWKVALPLDKKMWDAKNYTLEIEIQNTLIRVETPEKTGN